MLTKLPTALLIAAAQSQQQIGLVESLMNESVSDASEQPIKQTMSMNKFGCMVEESVFAHPYVEKVIKAPLLPFHEDHVQQEAWVKDATERHLHRVSGNAASPVYTCEDRSKEQPAGPFMLFPVFSGDVGPSNPKTTYEGRCFEEITFEYQ